jgi:hypothetical protein
VFGVDAVSVSEAAVEVVSSMVPDGLGCWVVASLVYTTTDDVGFPMPVLDVVGISAEIVAVTI